jgi:hypothetical protein
VGKEKDMAGRQPAWVRRRDASQQPTEILHRPVTAHRPRATYGAPPPALVAAAGRGAGYATEGAHVVRFGAVAAIAWLRAIVTVARLRAHRLALELELRRRINALGRATFEGDAGAELARARAHETSARIAEGRAAEARALEEARERTEQGRRRR